MSLIAAIGLTTTFTACTSSHGNHDHPQTIQGGQAQTSTVPVLKERLEGLGTPEERDHMLDRYDQALLDLKANDANAKAWLELAQIFIQEARVTGDFAYNYEASLDILDKLLMSSKSTQNEKFQALVLKATVKLSEHKFDEALTLGEEASRINPYNAFAYGIQVDANVELGNYKRAVEFSDKMVSTRPDLRSYSRISYLREIHGDVEGAIEAMELAISAGYPGFEETAWCRVTLARLYQQLGQLKEAEVQLKIALEERPNYPYALAEMGVVEMKKGNLKLAEESLEKATNLMTNPGFYENLIAVAQMQNDAEAEKTYTRKALRAYGVQEEEHEHSHGNETEHDHHDGNEHGHSHETGLELARFHYEYLGTTDEALMHALEAYKTRPSNIDVNLTLAKIYFAKENFNTAQMHLDVAKATASKNTDLHLLAGMLQIKQGDKYGGQKTIANAFETNPFQTGRLATEAKTYL